MKHEVAQIIMQVEDHPFYEAIGSAVLNKQIC